MGDQKKQASKSEPSLRGALITVTVRETREFTAVAWNPPKPLDFELRFWTAPVVQGYADSVTQNLVRESLLKTYERRERELEQVAGHA